MQRLLKPALWGLLALVLSAVAAVAQGYRVSPGDQLTIEVLEDESLNRTVLVAPDGLISFPLVGTIQAGGRTVGSIQTELVAQLEPNFAARPNVTVSLAALAPEEPLLPPVEEEPPTVAIFAMGEVASPGRVELVPGTTLLQALAQIGGFSDFAATRRMQLRRLEPQTGRERIYTLNYDAIMSGQSPNGRVTMREGDVILVPTRRLFE